MLRPLTAADLPLTMEWRNGSREHFLTSDLLTEEGHRAWFENYLKREDDFIWVIVLGEEPVGQCSLYNIDRKEHEAEFGRLVIAPGHRRDGIAKHAMTMVLRMATADLDVHIFFVRVRGTNHPATQLYAGQHFYPVMIRGDVMTMRRCG